MEERKYLPEKVKSFDELKYVFNEFNVDSEQTRFFIGELYLDEKAFVIYQDDFGEFWVYKMKANGERAVRYRGFDEKFAVNEFYQKFLDEVRTRPEFASKLFPVDNYKEAQEYGKLSFGEKFANNFTKDLKKFGSFIMSIISWPFKILSSFGPMLYIYLAIFLVLASYNKPDVYKQGYYYNSLNHKTYYQYHTKWYLWDELSRYWYYIDYIPEFTDYNYDYSNDWYDYNDFYEFEGSDEYYVAEEEYNNYLSEKENDSWSWGSGWSDSDSWDSWDSGGTDWDSDW